MKNYIIVTAIASILTVPALFADTTGTGTTRTGTTGTGVSCITGSTVQANQAALLAAQQVFSAEIARLVAQKQTAYSGAQTLTGTARVTALQSANVAFRTEFMTAIKTLNAVKQSNRAHHSDIRECKKEVKKIEENEKKEEKKEHKEEIKSQVKSLKDRIKEIRQTRNNRNSHR